MITINTLYYTGLWVIMMLVGGACYEQRLIVKKRNGKKFPVLEFVGGVILSTAMLGLIHGVLAFFHLILPL